MEEKWKQIEGYENLYEVSNFGNVKSLNYKRSKKEHLLRPQNNHKYLKVVLTKDNHINSCLVHILVARAFPEICGEWFEGAEINHKDENPENNCAWNLEWVTHKENCYYGTRNKRIITNRIGKTHEKPVFQYDLKGTLICEWKSANEAGKNGFIRQAINACCLGKRKSHKGYLWSYKKMEPRKKSSILLLCYSND